MKETDYDELMKLPQPQLVGIVESYHSKLRFVADIVYTHSEEYRRTLSRISDLELALEESLRRCEMLESTFQRTHGCHISWVKTCEEMQSRAGVAEAEVERLRAKLAAIGGDNYVQEEK